MLDNSIRMYSFRNCSQPEENNELFQSKVFCCSNTVNSDMKTNEPMKPPTIVIG